MMSRRRAVPVRQQRAPFIFFVFFCVHKGRLASQTGFRRGYNGFLGSNNGALGEGATLGYWWTNRRQCSRAAPDGRAMP